MEASDRANALDLLQAQVFDLVIMDFVTPKLYGVKFVERLYTLQERVPIIFIRSQLSVISLRALLDDVAEVLVRPFHPTPAQINIPLIAVAKSMRERCLCPPLTYHHSLRVR